jgi:hypothetical protein
MYAPGAWFDAVLSAKRRCAVPRLDDGVLATLVSAVGSSFQFAGSAAVQLPAPATVHPLLAPPNAPPPTVCRQLANVDGPANEPDQAVIVAFGLSLLTQNWADPATVQVTIGRAGALQLIDEHHIQFAAGADTS